jgi:hypothetical protein
MRQDQGQIIKVKLYEEIGAWYHHGRAFNQTAPSPQHGVGSAARLQRRLGCTSLRTDHLTRRLATTISCCATVSSWSLLCFKSLIGYSYQLRQCWHRRSNEESIDHLNLTHWMAVVNKVVTLADQLLVISGVFRVQCGIGRFRLQSSCHEKVVSCSLSPHNARRGFQPRPLDSLFTIDCIVIMSIQREIDCDGVMA